jgi:hypothetical protein
MSDEELIKEMEVPLTGVSDDGSFYGTITKEMREHVDFDELLEESETIKGRAIIQFKK